ncbi:MAG TPA: CDP-alcohol phosphatidyltransferase family protein [Acidimicrobiia bacterium]
MPNLVSFIRLLLVPVFLYLLIGLDEVAVAGALVFLIGATDWVDGYLARRLNQVSELGKALDPLADRLMIIAALIGGLIAGVVPAVIVIPLLARELVVGVAAILLASRTGRRLEVRFRGKAATFLIYGAVASFYLAAAGVAPWLFTPPAWMCGVIGLVLYWDVAFIYLKDVAAGLSSVESPVPQ